MIRRPDCVLVLFAGAADGWGVGLGRLGFKIVALAESDPQRREALRKHHPEAIIYDDVRAVTAARLLTDLGYLPGVVVGSPPCQDISSANNGRAKGVDGERSGLYFEFIRIVGEVGPDWYAAENSSFVKTRGYDRLHVALGGVGYTCWPQVVRAKDLGYFHLRARSWLVGVHVSDAAGQPLGAAGQPRQAASHDADAGRSEPTRGGAAGGWRQRPQEDAGAGPASYAGSGEQRVEQVAIGSGASAEFGHDGEPSAAYAGEGPSQRQLRPGQSDPAEGGAGFAANADRHRQQQPGGPVGEVGRRAGNGGEGPVAYANSLGRGEVAARQRPDVREGQAAPEGACGEGDLPEGLASIERAARALGLGGRSRLAEHYRMAAGVRAGLARLCISAYGDSLVPDIAELFGWVMPRLVAELRS